MLALCLMLSNTCHTQNYAGIIYRPRLGLNDAFKMDTNLAYHVSVPVVYLAICYVTMYIAIG